MRYLCLLILTCTLLSACQQSPRKNYYLITAPATALSVPSEHVTQVVGIGPIEVAEYLNRLQIVYQANDGSLVMAANDYWAEPLNKGIARAIALNLTHRDASRSFVHFPWRRDAKPQYSLRLQIHRLDRVDNQASIHATWELIDNTQKINIQRRHFIRSATAKSGAQGLAQAYSELIGELAAEMDSALP